MRMMYCKTVCGVCGKERIELEMNDSSMCPDRDLDFREWSMFQYGREAWIQECTECGFVSENLEEGKPSYLEFLNSKEYRIVDSIVLSNSLATLYYKYALFNLYLNRTEKAYYSYLHCSWCFDDRNNKEAAAHCRKKAIALFPFLEKEHKLSEEIVLIQADMLRRTGQFVNVKELLKNFHFHDRAYQQISIYQQMLADNEAIGCFKESHAYAYDIKTKDDWKENKILVISEHQIKKEILDKYYPGLSIREQLVFDRGWELVNKLNEYMECFYEKHRTTQKMIEYLMFLSNNKDYSFFSVQSPSFRSFLENTFLYYEKKEVIRYAVRIIEHMKLTEKSIEKYDLKEKETREFLDEIMKALDGYEDLAFSDEERRASTIVSYYNKAFMMLESNNKPLGHQPNHFLSYDECMDVIRYLKKKEVNNYELFGKEKDASFKKMFVDQEETFGGQNSNASIEENAAYLLYYMIKNQCFIAGNKTIAATLFLYYLDKNGRLLFFNNKIIDDAAVMALIAIVSTSRPDEKGLVIDLIVNCISMQWRE